MPLSTAFLTDPIEALRAETIEATKVLVERGLWTHALVVLYSTIDQLAWLSVRPEGTRVKQKHFERWVQRYMAGPWTANEIYLARCAVLHQRLGGQLPESSFERTERELREAKENNRAASGSTPLLQSRPAPSRELVYETPGGVIETVRVRKGSEPDVLVIKYDDLEKAFDDGARSFRSALLATESEQALATAKLRAAAWLRYIPSGVPAFSS